MLSSRFAKIVLAALVLAALFAMGIWLILRLPGFGGVLEGARLDRMRQSAQYVHGRFENKPPYLQDLAKRQP